MYVEASYMSPSLVEAFVTVRAKSNKLKGRLGNEKGRRAEFGACKPSIQF